MICFRNWELNKNKNSSRVKNENVKIKIEMKKHRVNYSHRHTKCCQTGQQQKKVIKSSGYMLH